MNNKNIDTNDNVPFTGKTVLNQDEHSFSYLTKFFFEKGYAAHTIIML